MDVPLFTPLKRFVVAAAGQNATGMLAPGCVARYGGEREKCLVAQAAARYLGTPCFVWQSRYDADQRACEMTAACAASAACVEAYGRDLASAVVRELGLRGQAPGAAPGARWHGARHGAFIDGCDRHCDEGLALPMRISAEGATPFQAFASWYANATDARQALWQQAATAYPCADCCNAACSTSDLAVAVPPSAPPRARPADVDNFFVSVAACTTLVLLLILTASRRLLRLWYLSYEGSLSEKGALAGAGGFSGSSVVRVSVDEQ